MGEVYEKVRDFFDRKDEAKDKFLAMDGYIREKNDEPENTGISGKTVLWANKLKSGEYEDRRQGKSRSCEIKAGGRQV
jgi:hypothetical protein